MTCAFTESVVEQAALAWLESLGYPRIDVATFKKAPRKRKEKRSQ